MTAPVMCERHRLQELVLAITNGITWKYVTGGRAAHAFFPGEDVPCCGVQAFRGPESERRAPRWHRWGIGMSHVESGQRWTRRGHHRHRCCERLAKERINMMMRSQASDTTV